MAAAVKGWCPVHDRVFESRDGLCPKCGTALVSDEPAERPPVVIRAEPQSDSAPDENVVKPKAPDRRTLVTVAAGVLIAFLAGLAFPDGEKQTTATPATTRDVTADLNVGVTRMSDGSHIALRLESFTQRGRNVVARISVREGAELELGRLRGIHVVFTLAGGGEISDNLAPRTTVSGFILSGTFLQRGDLPVVGIRIDALHFEGGEFVADVPLDISEVWPASSRNEPRTAPASVRIRPSDGRTLTINGMVGWADRLELGITARGGRPGMLYVAAYTLVGRSVYRGLEALDRPAQGPSATYTVRFEELPDDEDGLVLQVETERVIAEGPWEWSFI